ncbi:MAG TPA: tyrosine-type recombinase/integrase [Gemmataceae bacterium]|nr:tyrosine-type recombinase/integrase [Gemmataceae bacterium]
MSENHSTVHSAADQPDATTPATPATPAASSSKRRRPDVPLPPPRGSRPKPAKPRPDFPLFPHAAGVWAKKIRGKMYYFGPWEDPEGALKKYEAEKEALHAGRKPRADPEAVTVKDVVNAFLTAKKTAVDNGELSSLTWKDYRAACDEVVGALGKGRVVADLRPDDFARLRDALAKRCGPHRLKKMILCVRMAFGFAYDNELTASPVRYGQGFKVPSKKTLRTHKAACGAQTFTADELRRMLAAATVPMRAMFLLGINAGMGNSDVARLPLAAVNLDTGWIDFPRPKTGMPRRCPLWPETVDAIRAALAVRPEPKDPADAALVFVTKYGHSWSRDVTAVSQETRKLLARLDINGRHRLGFYTLRHTFRTIADGAKDQPAADLIMGHEVAHMSSVYREGIDDARLKAVADHVRAWLFPPGQSSPVV